MSIAEDRKDRKKDYDKIGLEFFNIWKRIAVSLGWDEPKTQGFDFKEATNVDDYLNKWATAQEMTKGYSKSNESKGVYTPFSLLYLYATTQDETLRKQCAALYKDFIAAFKGARQLTFSKGLKEMCGVEQIEDKDITEDKEDDLIIAKIIDWQIKFMDKARSNSVNDRYKGLPKTNLLVEIQNNVEIWAIDWLRDNERDLPKLGAYLSHMYHKWWVSIMDTEAYQAWSYSTETFTTSDVFLKHISDNLKGIKAPQDEEDMQ